MRWKVEVAAKKGIVCGRKLLACSYVFSGQRRHVGLGVLPRCRRAGGHQAGLVQDLLAGLVFEEAACRVGNQQQSQTEDREEKKVELQQ